MNQNPEGGRKRVTSRQWRFTQNIATSPRLFPDYKSTSPKLNKQQSGMNKGSNQNLARDHQKQFHESQTAQIKKLVSYLSENRSQYPALVGYQKVRSEAQLELPQKADETESVLKSIIHAGEQYRRELMKNQQRKAKGIAQNVAVKRQIDTVHKERQTLHAQNILLKSEKSLLQKQLLIVRDNADRMKRKFQLELHQTQCELQEIRNKNHQLDDLRKQLTFKVDNMVKLEESLKNYERNCEKHLSQLQKAKNQNQILKENNGNLQKIYNQLFQNYTKLEVHSQGLEKEVVITKSYLSNTQTQYSQIKQEIYRLQEERVKSLDQKNKEISKKNSQIALMSKKIQEQGVYLQARQKSIAELEIVVGELTKKISEGGQDNNKLKNQITTLHNKLSDLDKQTTLYQQHIQNLSVSCKQQETNRQKSESVLVKVYKQYGNKEIQWAKTLNDEINSITNQYDAKLFELESIIEEKELSIKKLQFRSNQAQSEAATLKQICEKLKSELNEYSAVIKEKMDQINYLKSQNKNINNKAEELSKIIQEKETKRIEVSQENSELRQIIAEMTETLKLREVEVANFELELKKHSQKMILLSEVKQKSENEYKGINELIEKLTASLNEQNLKNVDLSKKVIFKEQEIKALGMKIEELQLKIQELDGEKLQLQAKIQNLQKNLENSLRENNKLLVALSQREKYITDQSNTINSMAHDVEEKKKNMEFLHSELTKLVQKQEMLKVERQSLSKMLGNKTSENQKLKLKLIESQEALQNRFVSNIESVKLEHQKSMKKLDSQKQQVVIKSTVKDDRIKQLQRVKNALQTELNTLNMKNNENVKQIRSYISTIAAGQERVNKLVHESEEKTALIEKMEKDLKILASKHEDKSKYAETLKKELLVQEEELKDNFIQNYKKQSEKHRTELQSKAKENQTLTSELQVLSLYKIKCNQLQNQVSNLSQILKVNKLNLDNERNKNKNLIAENQMVRGSIKQIQGQLTARYEGEILSRSERFERQYSSLSHQTSELRNHSLNLKEEVDTIKKSLQQKENLINSLRNELQQLKVKTANDIQNYQTQINELRRSNGEIGNQFSRLALQAENDRKQRDSLISSAITFEKSNNAIVEKVSILEGEFADLQKLLNDLRDQREILIKKYIILANEIQKEEKNPDMTREVDSIGQHFSKVSLIHSEISKKLGTSKILVGEVQKSKVIGLSVISSSIISQFNP